MQWIAKVAPLWHGVVVARGFTTGNVDWLGVAGHLGYVALWIVVGIVRRDASTAREVVPVSTIFLRILPARRWWFAGRTG